MSIAPRVFSKLMRYAVEPLRAKVIHLVYYLDDICDLAKTKTMLQDHVKSTMDHLSNGKHPYWTAEIEDPMVRDAI
jgi:hypothetical protein